MKLRDFLELNMSITDLYLYVREGGNTLKDFLAIGLDAGVKPPFPMVIDRHHKGQHEGTYMHKSINAWDDGADYWQTKVNRVPSAWLDLEVYSFHQRYVYRPHHPRAEDNPADGYEGYEVVLLPSGEVLTTEDKTKKPKEDAQCEGQMNITEFMED